MMLFDTIFDVMAFGSSPENATKLMILAGGFGAEREMAFALCAGTYRTTPRKRRARLIHETFLRNCQESFLIDSPTTMIRGAFISSVWSNYTIQYKKQILDQINPLTRNRFAFRRRPDANLFDPILTELFDMAFSFLQGIRDTTELDLLVKTNAENIDSFRTKTGGRSIAGEKETWQLIVKKTRTIFLAFRDDRVTSTIAGAIQIAFFDTTLAKYK